MKEKLKPSTFTLKGIQQLCDAVGGDFLLLWFGSACIFRGKQGIRKKMPCVISFFL